MFDVFNVPSGLKNYQTGNLKDPSKQRLQEISISKIIAGAGFELATLELPCFDYFYVLDCD